MSNTVKMVREDGHTADVHPNMIEEYRKGGYDMADKQPQETKRGRTKQKQE